MHVEPETCDAFRSAVRHVNVSRRNPIATQDLLAAILNRESEVGREAYVRAFFDETAVETLSDIARSGLIDYGRLAIGARRVLPPGHETRIWLDERV